MSNIQTKKIFIHQNEYISNTQEYINHCINNEHYKDTDFERK